MSHGCHHRLLALNAALSCRSFHVVTCKLRTSAQLHNEGGTPQVENLAASFPQNTLNTKNLGVHC